MPFLLRHVLWVDCIGAFLTGLLILTISSSTAPLYGIPQWMVVAHAFVHLAYGSYSFSLAIRRHPRRSLIKLLVFANAAWAGLCMLFATAASFHATGFAVAHFLIEGIYVGSLAALESKFCKSLPESDAG